MGQIEDLRLFVSVVDSGGIARAAEEMNIAKSAVSRRLGLLEDRYGVRLIDRQPRVWEVTTAGQELYQRASRMVADADELDADFMHASHSLKGPLSITIAREFGLSFLKPALFAFMESHPEIDLTVDFDDRTVDLERENYDMAVRITEGDLGGLVALKLGTSRHGLFASPRYVAEHGHPTKLEQLTKHPLLHYGAAKRATWEFMCEGKKKAVRFQPALNSNSGPFLKDAAVQGAGIVRLPDFIATDPLESGELVPILAESEIAEWSINLIYDANRRMNKRMRALMTTLQTCCADLPEPSP